MENNSGVLKSDDQMGLPRGFRFHPTDEELITHYLAKKVLDCNFPAVAIGEVDMNKVEPWDLPWKAKLGEKEWYFFCVRDKKYPTGLRTNRATAAGYWKATGKDKEIFRRKTLVGMKKTLVFYIGRAPKGEKSNWVIHEYRLEGKLSTENLPKLAKNDWVIIRVFHKTSGGKKDHISGLMRMNSLKNELDPLPLPPLMDSSPNPGELDSRHVHCFSNSNFSPQQKQENIIPSFNNPIFPSSSNPTDSFAFNNQFYGQFSPFQGGTGFQFPGSSPLQDPSLIKNLFGNYYGQNMSNGFLKQKEMICLSQETENSSVVSNLETGKRSFEEQEAPSTSIVPQDLDCIWSY